MKLFGNSRRSDDQPKFGMEQPAHERETRAESARSRPEKRQPVQQTGSRSRALLFLGAAICVFIASLVMCFALMEKSKDVTTMPDVTLNTELKYTVSNGQTLYSEEPTEPDETTTEEPVVPGLVGEAPESAYESERVNILLFTPDGDVDRTDTVMLASVDLEQGALSLLSFPRDIYISGNFDLPKLNQVYGSYDDTERATRALREKVEEMIGFKVDYYFALNEDVLQILVGIAGGVDFEVPEDPAYHSLESGTQTITDAKAFELFRFNESYGDVEYEPCKVQRDFLLALLKALPTDSEEMEANITALSEVMDTDLSPENLLFLGNLLRDADYSDVVSRGIPGGEISTGGEVYYEVDPEAAVEVLNEHFNPTDEDLTIYDVNFRQKTGSSTEGSFATWSSATSATEEPTEPDESTEPSESDGSSEPTESTENTEPEPSESDPPTEPTPSEPDEPDPAPDEP